ncbi:unnamed protein product (macronuclear) [Paramecium tetraurelia]|uniref:RGS domain-containing protein n=1 Tax=Paramecium tetraurelia TaxID=5888 RepID=A0CF97_PARTE|nr:uncharacterized protein GSPATT00037903001 [Paramecium tetraurelia]CAK69464.1 unnamed protein product [Paramecium tetraurelia]|eukprot:XP_001436861.1 hypothetical protein (macronuclear) [Paramecium tetraurelia strain d4-2]
MNYPQQVNSKGDFKEFMDKHPEYSYQLSFSEIKSSLDSNQLIYEYELRINNIVPIKRRGIQKKVVEKELFKCALELVNSEQFQRFLDDSMKSQLDNTFDGSSNSISEIFLNQNDSCQNHQRSQILQLLSQYDDQIQQAQYINEDVERMKRILNY